MDEEISIIDTQTRNEKIKKFFVDNKKKFFILIFFIILLLFVFFGGKEYNDRKKVDISNLYNSIVIDHSQNNKEITAEKLVGIINKKDPTYSPLSLYFIIDNQLIEDEERVNQLFDIIINEVSLKKEIKNLIIYKKALFNADTANENELLNILSEVINSESIWKSHALYLLAEYFYSKNEKEKAKEFFNQIIILENANQEIKIEAQKRLNRDLSD